MAEPLAIPEGQVPVIDPHGAFGFMPPGALDQQAVAQGFRQASPQDIAAFQASQKYGGVGQGVAAAAEGFGSALTFGLSTGIERMAGVPAEDIQGRKQVQEIPHALGTMGGVALPLILTAGAAAPAEAAAVGAEGATTALGALRGVAELSAPSLIGRMGRAAAGAVEGAELPGIAGRVLPGLAQGAAEGAAFTGGDQVERAILGDPNLGAEQVAAQLGVGALLGGVLMGGGKVLGEMIPKNLGEEATDWLGKTAGSRNLKAAGAIQSDLQKALKTKGEEGLNKIGQEFGERGLVGPLTTPKDTLSRAQALVSAGQEEASALTAAGDAPAIRSATNLAPEKYLYHVTPSANEEAIAREGLRPDAPKIAEGGPHGETKAVFLSDHETAPTYRDLYGDGATTTYRVQKSALSGLEEDKASEGNAWLSRKAVLPEHLEVLREGKWAPVTPTRSGPIFTWNEIRAEMEPKLMEKLQSKASTAKAAEALKGELDNLSTVYGDRPLGLTELHALRTDVDKLAGYGTKNMDPAIRPVAGPLKTIRGALNGMIEDGLEKTTGSGEAWREAMRKQEVGLTAMTFAQKGMVRAQGNNLVSPTEFLGALGGGMGAGPAGALAMGAATAAVRRHASGVLGWAATGAQKALLGFMERTEGKVASGVRAIFEGESAAAAGDVASKVTRETFPHVASGLGDLHQNLDRMAEVTAGQTSGLREHAPATADALNALAARGIGHLAPKVPQGGPKLALDRDFTPSSSELSTLNKHLEIAQSPTRVLDHIARGTYSPEHHETLTVIYPKLHEQMKLEVLDRLAKAMAKGERIPRKVRMGLSMFLGQDLDSSMTGQAIAAAQGVYAAQPAEPGPGAPAGGGKVRDLKIDPAGRYDTGMQAGARNLREG